MLASTDGVARTVTRASGMASPSCEKKKTSDAHVSVTLRCEFLLLGGLRRHTTSCLHLREWSDVQSRTLRFD